jgi:hypothetical protein
MDSLEIIGATLRVNSLEISRKDVADHFACIEEGQRAAAFIETVEVGVFCLERCRSAQDAEFMRRQVDSVLAAIAEIPSILEKGLIAKIGHGDGQVLAPIMNAVKTTSAVTEERLKGVRRLLEEDIDPAKQTSVLGRALAELKRMVDAEHKGSIQSSLQQAVTGLTAGDGALIKAMKAALDEAVKPLAEEVNRLAKEIRGQQAAEEVLQQTVQKGFTYQDMVVAEMQAWGQATGAQITLVGDDNRPGDIVAEMTVVSVGGVTARIVVEVRDRQGPAGRKAISDMLAKAMAERQANAALFVSHTRDGLALEIGEWAEGQSECGPWVATTGEHLTTALRFLVALRQIEELRAAVHEVDVDVLVSQVQRVRTALLRIASINRKVTSIRTGASDIQCEAEALRDEIRSALCAIEDGMRLPPPEGDIGHEANAA